VDVLVESVECWCVLAVDGKETRIGSAKTIRQRRKERVAKRHTPRTFMYFGNFEICAFALLIAALFSTLN
jgi:hypothetical protein